MWKRFQKCKFYKEKCKTKDRASSVFVSLKIVDKFENKPTAPAEALVTKSFSRNGIVVFEYTAFFFVAHIQDVFFYDIGNFKAVIL